MVCLALIQACHSCMTLLSLFLAITKMGRDSNLRYCTTKHSLKSAIYITQLLNGKAAPKFSPGGCYMEGSIQAAAYAQHRLRMLHCPDGLWRICTAGEPPECVIKHKCEYDYQSQCGHIRVKLARLKHLKLIRFQHAGHVGRTVP